MVIFMEQAVSYTGWFVCGSHSECCEEINRFGRRHGRPTTIIVAVGSNNVFRSPVGTTHHRLLGELHSMHNLLQLRLVVLLKIMVLPVLYQTIDTRRLLKTIPLFSNYDLSTSNSNGVKIILYQPTKGLEIWQESENPFSQRFCYYYKILKNATQYTGKHHCVYKQQK